MRTLALQVILEVSRAALECCDSLDVPLLFNVDYNINDEHVVHCLCAHTLPPVPQHTECDARSKLSMHCNLHAIQKVRRLIFCVRNYPRQLQLDDDGFGGQVEG